MLNILEKENCNDIGTTLRFSSWKRHQNRDVAAKFISRLENRRQKHNVVTTLVFSGSNNLENTTLWQRYPTLRPKYNQNLTFTTLCANWVSLLSRLL